MSILLQPENLILASGSPRRKEILKEAGINFLVKTKPTEEVYPPSTPLHDIPVYLAKLKAEAFRQELNNKVILAADTIVILQNKVIGKPSGFNEAFSMLKSLSGNKHQVITGVCLLSNSKEITFSDTTEVYFKNITDEQIEYYLNNYKPYDKAGSYGIQEWIGYIAIEKIVGSFYNVMGLPVHKVIDSFKSF